MTNNSRLTIVMILLGIIGLCVWAFQNERYSNAPSLTVNRKQAIGYAMHYLDTQDKLPSQILQVHAKVFRNRPDNNARNLYYVWQKDGPDVYNKLTDKYIYPTSWLVSIYADTVNYHVYLNGNGKAYRTTIEFADPLASTSKTKDDAVKYALDALQTDKSTNIETLTLFKADSTLIHGRTDWTIQFQDDSLRYLTDSQLIVAVKMAGDRIFDIYRYVKVPDTWMQQTKPIDKKLFRLKSFAMIFMFLLFLPAVIIAMNSFLKGDLHLDTFLHCFVLFIFCFIIYKLLYIPSELARLSPNMPLFLQWMPLAIKDVIRFLLLAIFVCILAAYLKNWKLRLRRQSTSVIWSALGFSTFILGVHFSALRLFPKHIPYLPNILPAESLSPIFTYAIHTFITYMVVLNLATILVFYIHKITHSGERNVVFATAITTLFAALCAIILFQNHYSWLQAYGVAVYSLAMALAFILGYIYIFRYNIGVLSLSVFILTLAFSVDFAIIHPFPGIGIGTLVASLLMLMYAILGLSYKEKQ